MFDFGNDDKEKLRENMEQIKEMVNEGKTVDQQPEGMEQGFGDEDLGGFEEDDKGMEPGQDETGQQGFDSSEEFDGDDVSGTQNFSEEPGQEEEVEQELDEFEEKFGGQEQEAQQQPQQPQEQGQQQQAQSFDNTAPNTPPENQQRSQTTKGGMMDSRDTEQLSQEVPSPPETRELNVPEIDRGPLFLRQQKFLRAKQMIEDMLYLSDEMEKTVNDLEAGLQEDKGIERDVVEILREFEDNRTEVEDIISPREE
jgi:hypothetical protein